ncbi:MAG: PAS domain-containing protein [Lachnospiraceae bacterium]|nr:PAS domain-containing protein [Lachnospiraceae bacterium]
MNFFSVAMKLTETDRQIFNSYKCMLDPLAEYLGPGYEIILHSLENYDKSAIKVINGHYSGRTEGAPLTDLALQLLDKFKSNPYDAHGITYYNKTISGVPIRSTTIPIRGENKRLIGLLCFNFHMDLPISSLLEQLAFPVTTAENQRVEIHANNIDDLIMTALQDAREQVLSNPQISTANRNKEIIALLNEKSIFNLKDSVSLVARYMGISKNTVYLHLRNMK